MKKELGILGLLLALCAVTATLNPKFLSGVNLSNMANLVGMFGIFSIGIGLVIITGGIDLSVGSTFALLGVLLAMMLREWNWPWPAAALAIVVLPMGLGWVHGFLVTRARIQPFIVTLCGLLLYRGIARFIAGDSTKGFGSCEGFEWLRDFATARPFGVPMPFLLLAVVGTIMAIVLHRSVYGRHLLAVGRNEDAARYSGVNTVAVIRWAYILGGLLTGISAVLFAFYTNSISPSTHGNFYELYGIAAAVLGGCSLRGGEGTILGVVIGTALLQVLQNLVNLLGIPSSLNFAVMGGVVLAGVLADQIITTRREKRRVSRGSD
jgi:ribose transport system permease protein